MPTIFGPDGYATPSSPTFSGTQGAKGAVRAPAPETTWKVPATSGGVLASRNLERSFSHARRAYPDNLLIDNTNGTTRIVLHINGHERPVAAGGTLEVRQREVGLMQAYGIIPDAAIAANAVLVYERRVGNGGVVTQ